MAALQFLYINLINLIIKVQGMNMVVVYGTSLKIDISNIYSKISKNKYKIWVNESSVAENFKIAFLPSSTRHSDVTIKWWHLDIVDP